MRPVEDNHQPDGSTWYCIRRQGLVDRSGWIGTVPLDELPQQVRAADGSVVEACVTTDYRPVAPDRFSRVFRNRARGLIGMEIA